ncbi:C-type lectin domain family 4 member E-like [Erpetoichthys calabaricus]|uniref:C-type lectin domain family 4 member E-like n=1 Tax=Erpetoichthys calabaricus TaxID=27687 RepID=UPI002233ED28|nr:C-type lectin domain family 4 member E-like [Erpetoichthys calabaricus]
MLNRSCYFFSTDKMDWNSSRDNCTGMGAQLVIMNSVKEQKFLQGASYISTTEGFWIGLNDIENEGQWRWVDNSTLSSSLTAWTIRNDGTQEPDNWTGKDKSGEDCVRLSLTWFDASCKEQFYRICEKST